VGWVFLWSEWGKLNNLPAIVENFAGWHIPASHMRAYMNRLVFIWCRLGLLLVSMVAAAFVPTVVLAQNTPPISADEQRRVLTDPGIPELGEARADITVVEYFDYNCPFCRSLAPTLRTFTAVDHAAAVLYKEWPIFGGVSVYAARLALAANYQGKYLQAHDALISAPRLAQNEQVDEALRRAGIDMPRLQRDAKDHRGSIDALLNRNSSEAHQLGLRGTPGILVGRTVVSSIADLTELQAAVSAARHARSSHAN
jgi:protein-disulfide isomerase